MSRPRKLGPIEAMDLIDIDKKLPFMAYVMELDAIARKHDSLDVKAHQHDLIQKRFREYKSSADALEMLQSLYSKAQKYPHDFTQAFLGWAKEEIEETREEIKRRHAQLEVKAAAHKIDLEIDYKKKKDQKLVEKIKSKVNWGESPRIIQNYISNLDQGESVIRHSNDSESREILHKVLRDYTFDVIQDSLPLKVRLEVMQEAERRGYIMKEEFIAYQSFCVEKNNIMEELSNLEDAFLIYNDRREIFEQYNYLFLAVEKQDKPAAEEIRNAAIRMLYAFVNDSGKPYLRKEEVFKEIRKMDVFCEEKSRGLFARRALDNRVVLWDTFITLKCNEVRQQLKNLEDENKKPKPKPTRSETSMMGDMMSGFHNAPRSRFNYEVRKSMIENSSGAYHNKSLFDDDGDDLFSPPTKQG